MEVSASCRIDMNKNLYFILDSCSQTCYCMEMFYGLSCVKVFISHPLNSLLVVGSASSFLVLVVAVQVLITPSWSIQGSSYNCFSFILIYNFLLLVILTGEYSL